MINAVERIECKISEELLKYLANPSRPKRSWGLPDVAFHPDLRVIHEYRAWKTYWSVEEYKWIKRKLLRERKFNTPDNKHCWSFP